MQYGKHLLQQQKDKMEKIKDLAEAAEERRKKEEKEKKKRDWEQQLKEIDDCLNEIRAKKVQLGEEIQCKIKLLSDKRCDINLVAQSLGILNTQKDKVMEDLEVMLKNREKICKHL